MNRILSTILLVVVGSFLGLVLWVAIFMCMNSIYRWGQNAIGILPFLLFFGIFHGFLAGLAVGLFKATSILRSAIAGVAASGVVLLILLLLLGPLEVYHAITGVLFFTAGCVLAGAIMGVILGGILRFFGWLRKPKPEPDVVMP